MKCATAALVAIAMLVVVSPATAATLTLAWDAPTDGVTTGYIVRYGTASGNYTQSVNVGMATSYSVTSLADGTTYFFAVQAYNAAGELSVLSAEVSGMTGLAPPSTLVALVREGVYIDLSWLASAGATGHRVEVGSAPGLSDIRTVDIGAVTMYTLSGLANGKLYIRVRTLSSGGVSAPSNEVVVTLGSTPEPPSNLAASLREGRYVDLAWQASTGCSGYRVEVGTAPGLANVTTANATTSSFTVANLASGKYYIRVRSFNDFGVSEPSNEVVVDVAPGVPLNLTARLRKLKIDLSWQAPTPAAAGYRIEVGSATGLSDLRSISVGAVTAYTISDLPAGKYYIRVRSVSGTLVSAPSNEVVVTTTGSRGGKPSPPQNLAASVSDDNLIDLTWDPGDDQAESYRVEIGTAPRRTDVSSFTTGTTSRFSIGELPGARTYFLRVTAINEFGTSDPSNEVVVPGRGGEDAPRRLAAQVLGSTLRLTWERPVDDAGLTGYLIEAGTGPNRKDLGTVFTTDQAFSASLTQPGTFFVRVRSQRVHGLGPSSNEVAFEIGGTTTCSQAPGAPGFTARVLGTTVQLSWAPGLGDSPSGYILDVGTAPGRRDVGTFNFDASATEFSSPAPNGTYALRLTAVNACGASPLGSEAILTVGGPTPIVPGAPSNLVEQVAGRSVTLTWLPPVTGGEATRYIIEASDTQGNVLITMDTNNVSTTFVHGDVPPGTYVVRVRAANGGGAGAPSNAVTVTVTP